MVEPLLVFKFTEFVEKADEEVQFGEYRGAVLVAITIICLELIEKFSHSIFDFHEQAINLVTEKSLNVLLFRKNFRMSSTGRRTYTFA